MGHLKFPISIVSGSILLVLAIGANPYVDSDTITGLVAERVTNRPIAGLQKFPHLELEAFEKLAHDYQDVYGSFKAPVYDIDRLQKATKHRRVRWIDKNTPLSDCDNYRTLPGMKECSFKEGGEREVVYVPTQYAPRLTPSSFLRAYFW